MTIAEEMRKAADATERRIICGNFTEAEATILARRLQVWADRLDEEASIRINATVLPFRRASLSVVPPCDVEATR